MIIHHEELDGVQEGIEKAGRQVAGVIGLHATDPDGWGRQRLAYLCEATAHLNRAYSLVRAVYGPNLTRPGVSSPRLPACRLANDTGQPNIA